MTAFSVVDYVFMGVVLLGLLAGILRGFLKELYQGSAFLLAFLASVVFSLPVTEWAVRWIPSLEQFYFPAFLLLFICSEILLLLILNVATKQDKKKKKPLKSRIAGAFLGLVNGSLAVGFISWLLMMQRWIEPESLFSGDMVIYPLIAEKLMIFTNFYQ